MMVLRTDKGIKMLGIMEFLGVMLVLNVEMFATRFQLCEMAQG